MEEQQSKAGYTAKAQTEAATAYQKRIAQLYPQGHALKTTFGPASSNTLVFVKGQ